MKCCGCVHKILEICVTKFEAIAQGHIYVAICIPDNTSLDLRVLGPKF